MQCGCSLSKGQLIQHHFCVCVLCYLLVGWLADFLSASLPRWLAGWLACLFVLLVCALGGLTNGYGVSSNRDLSLAPGSDGDGLLRNMKATIEDHVFVSMAIVSIDLGCCFSCFSVLPERPRLPNRTQLSSSQLRFHKMNERLDIEGCTGAEGRRDAQVNSIQQRGIEA